VWNALSINKKCLQNYLGLMMINIMKTESNGQTKKYWYFCIFVMLGKFMIDCTSNWKKFHTKEKYLLPKKKLYGQNEP